jgi:hypothetical protein
MTRTWGEGDSSKCVQSSQVSTAIEEIFAKRGARCFTHAYLGKLDR